MAILSNIAAEKLSELEVQLRKNHKTIIKLTQALEDRKDAKIATHLMECGLLAMEKKYRHATSPYAREIIDDIRTILSLNQSKIDLNDPRITNQHNY